MALQVSAARLSLRRPRARRTASAARARASSTSCSTPASSTDDRYFDVFVEYAKASPEDILDPDHRRPTAGPRPRTLHVLPTLWFRNTWTWWPGRPEAHPAGRSSEPRGHARGRRVRTPSSATAGSTCEGDAPAALHRERDQHRSGSRHAEREPLRQGRHQRLRRARPARRGQPRRHRHQGGGAPPARPSGPGRRRCSACGSPTGARAAQDPFAGFDERVQARRAEADEFYRAITPPRSSEDDARRHAAGAGRHAVDEAVLLLRRRQVARGARRRPVRRAHGRTVAEPRVGPHGQRPRHLHARQVGVPVVRGLGPGLPRDRPRRRSTSTSPSSSST